MTAVLDAVDAGARGFSDHHWGEYALAEMIPSPSPTSGDTDPDATISAARDGWPTPPELTRQIERLLPHAAGYWHAADNLIGLLKTMPLADQARTGLPWVHQIITSRAGRPAWARGWPWNGSARSADAQVPTRPLASMTGTRRRAGSRKLRRGRRTAAPRRMRRRIARPDHRGKHTRHCHIPLADCS